MNDCIFCKIIAGDIPCHKVYEDDYTLAFLDISKDYIGHTLVLPKVHVVNMLDAHSDTIAHVMNSVAKISRHYVDNCGYSGVNVISNCGEHAGQSVMHMHVHIIPRRAEDNQEIFVAKQAETMDLQLLAQKLAL